MLIVLNALKWMQLTVSMQKNYIYDNTAVYVT